MAPQNHPERIASGAANNMGIDFGTGSARSIVADATIGGCERSFGRLVVKAIRCDPRTE